MSKHLVTLGDLVLDLVLPVTLPVEAGTHQAAADRRIEPGGAANTIFTARHLGLAVTVVGAVGSDAYGELILAPLRAVGADCRLVSALPDATSTLVVTLTDRARGEHVFVGHYDTGPAVPYPAGLDDRLKAADALFLSGYTLAETRLSDLARRALDQAHRSGVPIYLDVGPFLQHADRALVRWALDRAHLLFLTKDETAQLPGDGAADLLAFGPVCVVVKRGARGCTVITADHRLDVPAFPVARVIDTVGAGDTFAAAFIAGRLNGLDDAACARLANATGAASTAKVGAGSNAPTHDEIQAVLDAAGETIRVPG